MSSTMSSALNSSLRPQYLTKNNFLDKNFNENQHRITYTESQQNGNASKPYKTSGANDTDPNNNEISMLTVSSRVCLNIPKFGSVDTGPKRRIDMSLGDTSFNPHLKPCAENIRAMTAAIEAHGNHGYPNPIGCVEARKAVAKHWSQYMRVDGEHRDVCIDWNDVFITNGCLHAVDLCVRLLASEGTNILVPRPCFLGYQVLAKVLGVEFRHYNVVPERDWEMDLQDMEALIDEKTVAILYNNPSNPCGAVFSARHIRDFLAVAEKHNLPVIADEIYEDMVFPGHRFYACASFKPHVPVFTCGSISKKWLTPGWRMGWLIVHDRHRRFGTQIRDGLYGMFIPLFGINSIAQAALADIVLNTPKRFFQQTFDYIYTNARFAHEGFSRIRGLRSYLPSGAMYLMLGIDMHSFPHFQTDVEFVTCLAREESVICVPGSLVDYPGYLRIVLTVPTEDLIEAIKRLELFCKKYYN